METDAVRVRNYRCIEDSGWVSLDDIACLIGKNESGKTAFMEAVEQLNPSYPGDGYDPYQDYPRQHWSTYSERHEEEPATVASGRFHLGSDDVAAVEAAFGAGVLEAEEVLVHRDYKNERRWEIPVNESAADADGDGSLADRIGKEVLADRLPEFRYVSQYSTMDGTIDVEQLLDRRESSELTRSDQTVLSLLSIAGLDPETVGTADDWRETTTKLENASATVSDEAMQYWSQSGDLQIRIQSAPGGESDGRTLDVRVENRRENVTVEFEQRSRGFRWFFSTFCQLSELQQGGEELVVMLDEPGLNLHARAKQEFLDFLKQDLAGAHTVVYTTHSPFMIDPENLERTKIVMAEPIGETNVFTDVTLADDQTRFPLRNVFELDLMDTILVQPHALLVERKADHIYLSVLSKLLVDAGQEGLDSRWTVVPITDKANISSFVGLFGGDRLNVAALLTEPVGPERRGRGGEPPLTERIETVVIPSYTETGAGTIEDLCSAAFYTELVNRAYSTAIDDTSGVPARITTEILPDGDRPLVERFRQYFRAHGINDGVFDRGRPALYLQEHSSELAEALDRPTRRAFNQLFRDLNNTLESFDGVERRSRSLLDTLFG